MSRFGNLPVQIPEGVQLDISNSAVGIKGSRGELSVRIPASIKVEQVEGNLIITTKNSNKQAQADQGTTRSHLVNTVMGVTEGWKKQLEISGPGYRAEVRDKDLVVAAGYSHPINFPAPEGISFSVEKSLITVEGIDKGVVGQTAAKIKEIRKPNIYTGSGIKYLGEQIRRKAGKQAAAKGAE